MHRAKYQSTDGSDLAHARHSLLSPAAPAEATTTPTTTTTPREATRAGTAGKATTATAATPREPAATTAAETTTTTAATKTTAAPGGSPATTTGAAASTPSTSGLLDLGDGSRRGLGLGQEPLERQELLLGDVEAVAGLEGAGLDALGRLDSEEDLVQGTKDLVDLADGSLVLEVYRGGKVRDLGVDGLAKHLALARVHKLAHLDHAGRRAEVALLEAASACCFGEQLRMVSFVSLSSSVFRAALAGKLLFVLTSSSAKAASSASAGSSS